MNKIFVSFLLHFSFVGVLSAQTTTGRVMGTLTVQENEITPKIIVQLLSLPDSSVVRSLTADFSRQFTFDNLPEGKYIVACLFDKGVFRVFSEPIEITKAKSIFHLNPLILNPKGITLQNVNLISAKLFVEQKADRTVINVGSSITAAGSNIFEILEKSPGVIVTNEGGILLNGRPGVQIYIDNRPVYLSQTDLANLLRGMASDQISQIEIMSNPPAKFEAAGNAGIINLKSKKNTQLGHTGNISLTYGHGRLPKFNAGLNYNYQNSKHNFYFNFTKTVNRNFMKLDALQKFAGQTSLTEKDFLTQYTRRNRKSGSLNLKTGVDYALSNRTNIGFVFTSIYNPLVLNVSNVFKHFDHYSSLKSTTQSQNNFTNKPLNLGASFLLFHVIDSSKSDITAEFNYYLLTVQKNQDIVNSYQDKNGNNIKPNDSLLGLSSPQTNIYNAGLDYMKMLSKLIRLDIGIKSSFVTAETLGYYDSLHNGLPVTGSRRENKYVYKEFITGAYGSITLQRSKKLNIRVGMRAENTALHSLQGSTGGRFSQSYMSFFSSSSFQYSFNKKNMVAVNYSRRINGFFFLPHFF